MTDTKPRKRARRGERRELIIQGAQKIFAEQGFSASTRDIAASLGVTQALLYKYFPSKDALIEEVFRSRYATGAYMPDPEVLTTPGTALEKRVTQFYGELFDFLRDGSLRLFIRAALDGYRAHDVYANELVRGSILPLVTALRAELSLPGLDERKLANTEYEIAMAQHGGSVFIAIRNLVYERGPLIDVKAALAQHVRVWLPGALEEMKRIHADWDGQSTVPDAVLNAPGLESFQREA